MHSLLKKLNFKGQSKAVLLNVPSTLTEQLKAWEAFTACTTTIDGDDKVEFVLVFVLTLTEIELYVNQLLPHLKDETVLWMCYPKGSSKRYKCEFNRDNGWDFLGKHGFEPVRQVALDEDWSALRFKPVGQIKRMTRDEKMMLSEAAKKRREEESRLN